MLYLIIERGFIMKKFLAVISVIFLIIGCGDDHRFFNPPPADNPDVYRVPSEYGSIQDAIDHAGPGDIVLVADGIYSGAGNSDITFNGKAVTVRSENGPDHTVIDCDGSELTPHSAFSFGPGDDGILIDGFTITGGYSGNGGAINCFSSSPMILSCIFRNNAASASGGAIWMKGAKTRPIITNCTFARNSALAGGALFVSAGASPGIFNCIIAITLEGAAIYVRDNTCKPEFSSTIMWQNNGGNWVEEISSQLGKLYNLEVDPEFCQSDLNDFSLKESSPCLPENSASEMLIGATSALCGN